MDVDVVIPWRAGCLHREAALADVFYRWVDLGWTPTLAPAPEGEWCKAAAVTPAVEESTADIVIVADADVWCDGTPDAVKAVDDGAAWAVPHLMVHRLDQSSTSAVLAGGTFDEASLAENAYPGRIGGGIVVVRRDVYLDCPLDPRFVGWGQEDESWGMALTFLHGKPWTGTDPLWHLWHPPQPRQSRSTGSAHSGALLRRYKAARHLPERMRELVDEAKAVTV